MRRWTAFSLAALLGLVVSGASSPAAAHGSNPAVAWMKSPEGVGTVVDEAFTFGWADADTPIPTGTATVDFYYSARRPPAFARGDLHPLLEGAPVVRGILEKDHTNTFTWDTSAIPSGSYFLWSMVVEPPEEFMAPQIISFSPGVLTVAHPGEPVHPALIITTPATEFSFADEAFTIGWSAFDPDGTGRVRIEVGTSSLGIDYQTLVADAPAAQGELLWDTAQAPDGDWYIRGTITDGRGLSFTTYANYLLLVAHDVGAPDAGVLLDAGTARPDGGVGPDAGVKLKAPKEGCRCGGGGEHGAGWLAALAVITTWAGRRRTRTRARR